MLSISLADFKKLTGVRFVNMDDSMFKASHLKGISIDSRTIEPDQIFWALVGEHFNGHDFIKEARQKAALASVVAESEAGAHEAVEGPLIVVPDTLKALHELAYLQRKKYNIPVIGITGSNGKTTVKEMIAHILQTRLNVHKTKGNLNNQVGTPLTLINLNEHHEAAVIEMGTNHFGEIAVLTEMTEPNHALITMIGDTHLAFLESREGVFNEKRTLFDHLADGTIYLNMDDPFLREYNKRDARFVRYSCTQKSDIWGSIRDLNELGYGTFRLNDKVDIHLRVVGTHNVYNAIAASAVALNLKFSENEIKDALETFEATNKRMQVIDWNGIRIVNDTYNANPASMKSAIETLAAMKTTGKRVLVLGDMFELGEGAIAMHSEVLNELKEMKPDLLFLYGTLFKEALIRCEMPDSMVVAIGKSHEEIAGQLRKTLKPGDLLLLKGSRSMQMEKVMAHL